MPQSHGEATRKVTEVAEDVTPKSGSWGWMVIYRIKTHSAYLYMHWWDMMMNLRYALIHVTWWRGIVLKIWWALRDLTKHHGILWNSGWIHEAKVQLILETHTQIRQASCSSVHSEGIHLSTITAHSVSVYRFAPPKSTHTLKLNIEIPTKIDGW